LIRFSLCAQGFGKSQQSLRSFMVRQARYAA
jgi:hypothetical protein